MTNVIPLNMPTSNTTAINFTENGILYMLLKLYQFMFQIIVYTVVHTVAQCSLYRIVLLQIEKRFDHNGMCNLFCLIL